MPLVVKDRVRETSTTTGQGAVTLDGAVTGYQSFFDALNDGDTTYYTIYLQGSNQWEVGVGTYDQDTVSLSRDTVLSSSNGGLHVDFSAGVKDVFITYPAGRSVWYDTATNVTLNALTLSGGTANGVLYLNGSKVATSGSALTFDGSTFLTSVGSNLTTRIKQLALDNYTNDGVGITFPRTSDGAEVMAFGVADVDKLGLFSRSGLIFATAGGGLYSAVTEKMRITETGQVNIGGNFTSTNNTLQVTGNTAIGYTAAAPANGLIVAGNVGIGTDAPSRKLDVALTPAAQVTGATIRSVGGTTNVGDETSLDFQVFSTSYYNGRISGYVESVTGNGKGGLKFYTSLAGLSINATPSVTIDSSGNVGIGTDNPGAKLDVRVSGATTTLDGLYVYNGTAGGIFQTTGATYSYRGVGANNVWVGSNGGNDMYVGPSTANVLKLGNAGYEYMRIATSGNVGIGETNPAYKLDVAGSGGVALFRINNSTTGKAAMAFANNGNIAGAVALSGWWEGDSSSDMSLVAETGYGLRFYTNGSATEKAVIDTSGNFGLGVTPSAWTLGKVLQVGTVSAFWDFSNNTYLTNNRKFESGNKYIANGYATSYEQSEGKHLWLTAASGTAGDPITFTTPMTLDASGNLGIGTTSPSPYGGGHRVVHIDGGATAAELKLTNNTSGASGATGAVFQMLGNDFYIWNAENSFLSLGTNNTERARITSGGTFQTSLDASIYGVTVGRGAGAVISNTAVGADALAANTTGNNNTATGYGVMYHNTSGASNVANGVDALFYNTTGSSNVAVGRSALQSNTTASNNTAVGYQAGYTNNAGSDNVYIGKQAGYGANTINAYYNTFVGSEAGFGSVTAEGNSAFGALSLRAITSGVNNTALGRDALRFNTSASNNTAVGYQAGYTGTINTGVAAFGYQALLNSTGNDNAAFGAQALRANTTGTRNNAFGSSTSGATDGALGKNTTGSDNTAMGHQANSQNTTGSNNTAFGSSALYSNTTASNNTAVGYQTGYSNTTGTLNTLLGVQAGYANATGQRLTAIGAFSGIACTGGTNTFVGAYSGNATTTGTTNTFVGDVAGYLNTTGSSNSALGNGALQNNTTASNNTAVGYQAGYSNTTGNQQAFFGVQAGYSTTTGISNSAFGFQAFYTNTTGANNTAIGLQALVSNTTASNNTAVGYTVLYSNTTGAQNVGVGGSIPGTTLATLQNNTTGSYNTALGNSALGSNTTASYNTAVGYQSGYSQTTGGNNTSFGATSLYTTTTGTLNTAIGQSSLYFNTTGSNNTALGLQALFFNATASNNTAVGYQAGYSNTSGSPITAIGSGAAYSNTTGTYNVAIGSAIQGISFAALGRNTTGSYNVAVGDASLQANTTASNNTAVGYQAGYNNQTSGGAVFIGYQAGFTSTGISTTINYNTAIGWQSGYALTSGYGNTFVGSSSGNAVTSGYKNTILGQYNGNQGGLDIRTANNNIVLSDGDGNVRLWGDNVGALVTGLNGSTGYYAYTSNLGSIILNNGTTDTPNLQFATGSLKNWGIDSWNSSSGASNQYLRFIRDVNESTGAVIAALSEQGTLSLGNVVSGLTPINNGTGIYFPATQNASSNANTLDDYEEGTWTPAATAETAPTGVTYNFQGGWYRKVGSLVVAGFGINIASVGTGGSGELKISGFPFASASNGSYREPTASLQGGRWVTAALAGQAYMFINDLSTVAGTRYQNNADTIILWSDVQGGNASTGTYFNGVITYYV